MSSLEGAYSVVVVTGENELIAFRDPCGFRPLCYGKGSGFEVFSSESVALDAVGVDLVGDVKPGEMIVVDASDGRPLTTWGTAQLDWQPERLGLGSGSR